MGNSGLTVTVRHRFGERYTKAEHMQGREESSKLRQLSAIRMTREKI